MENRIPSFLLRAFLLIIAFTVASSALTASGQDSCSAGKADSARVVSLDAMLDHVDAVVRRKKERDRDRNGTVTAQRLWLGGDAYDAPVVLTRSGSSGNWTAHNVGRDILGSVTSVQSASGTIEEQRSYDPWGRARDPQTLVPYSAGSEPSYMLGRGFTGHEWLPNAALWNDNILGRSTRRRNPVFF